MNEKNIETRQQVLAEKDEPMVFVTRKKTRLSTASFIAISITLALIIAMVISFVPQFSGAYLVGGVMAVLMGIVVIQQPELGAYFLLIAVFTNLSDYATESGLPSVNQPLIALTYVSILVNYIIRRGNLAEVPRISRVEMFLLAYYLVIIVSLFVSVNNDRAFHVILDVTKDILAGMCLFLALNTKEKWRTAVWILIIVVANISLLGVIKMVSGTNFTFGGLAQLSELGQVDDTGQLRYGGPIGAPNIWAQVLVAIIPLVLYRFSHERNAFFKVNLLFAAALIALAVIYTGSRGAFVSLISILPLIAIERKVRFPTALAVVTAFMFLLFLLPSSYIKRFETLNVFFDTKNEYSLNQDESFIGRRNAMLTGLAMFRANPFLGVGFGNYGTSYWEYVSGLGISSSVGTIDPNNLPKPHSLYIEIMSETGSFGILSFSAFFGSLLIGILHARKKNLQNKSDPEWTSWLTAFFFSILSFLISGIFLHGIMWRYIWMLLGLAMGALAISENRSISLEKPKKHTL